MYTVDTRTRPEIYETMPTIRVHIFAVAYCISAIRYAAADSMASISVDSLTGDLHINPVSKTFNCMSYPMVVLFFFCEKVSFFFLVLREMKSTSPIIGSLKRHTHRLRSKLICPPHPPPSPLATPYLLFQRNSLKQALQCSWME